MTMDNWTVDQVLSMLEGGNDQLRGFLRKQKVIDSYSDTGGGEQKIDAGEVYRSKAAKYYRREIAGHVKRIKDKGVEMYEGRGGGKVRKGKSKGDDEEDEATGGGNENGNENVDDDADTDAPVADIIADDASSASNASSSSSSSSPAGSSDNIIPADSMQEMSLSDFVPSDSPVKSNLNEDLNESGDDHASPPQPPPQSIPQVQKPDAYDTSSREYTVSFLPGRPMEMSLERRPDGAAIVSRTVLGGCAHTNGVSVGSAVVEVDGMGRGKSFEEMVGVLGSRGDRVIDVVFRRPLAGIGSNPKKGNGYSQMGGIGSSSNSVRSKDSVNSNGSSDRNKKSMNNGSNKSHENGNGNGNGHGNGNGRGHGHGHGNKNGVNDGVSNNNNDKPRAPPNGIIPTKIGSNPEYNTINFCPTKPLGLVLSQTQNPTTNREQSQVTGITEGGQAECLGVQIGDVLVGVDGMGFVGHSRAVTSVKQRRKEGKFEMKFVR